ncbi:MAG: P-II family nitrogen regulator [Planctomycetota bacterium]
MKLVIAYIRPEKLNDVKQSLFKAEILKISVSNALGCGEEPNYFENYRGAGAEVDLHKRVRVEAAVNDQFVAKVIDAIIAGAQTGGVGDGKIFVLPIDDCVRIRTGERGNVAIG